MRVRVVGPAVPGTLVVELLWPSRGVRRVIEVESSRIPAALQAPNTSFVAAIRRGVLLRVERHGEMWLEIQDHIRAVLNESWDPIGVARIVDNEYEHYIAPLYWLLMRPATASQIADHLVEIETESMGLRPSSPAKLARVVAALQALRLPVFPS